LLIPASGIANAKLFPVIRQLKPTDPGVIITRSGGFRAAIRGVLLKLPSLV
jgi:hypothetical protein